jgi:hypothetical protein
VIIELDQSTSIEDRVPGLFATEPGLTTQNRYVLIAQYTFGVLTQ